jgi:cysteine synthase
VRPDAIVLSVGGGGLLCGVITGLRRHGWDTVRVLTAETDGAACFARAHAAGAPVRLDRITSIATSLGALEASGTAVRLAQVWLATALDPTRGEQYGGCAGPPDYPLMVPAPIYPCVSGAPHHRL